ncbi:two-component system histidine kinase PnpS [Aeribacillus pallidus]|uniref:two-component system histidine kinase PnpS n=1 Tax=Aeribacillus pallidus TaxID=33936 RepID=UPI003D23E487
MTRFKTRLLFALITLIFTVFIGLGLLLGQLFQNYYLHGFNERMKKETEWITHFIEKSGGIDELNEEQLHRFSDLMDLRLTIIRIDGTVIFDSGSKKETVPGHQAMITKIGKVSKEKGYESLNGDIQYYWQSIKDDAQEREAYTVVSTQINVLEKVNRQIWILLAVTLGIALVVIILLGAKITDRYTKPIESATKVAIELAKGNYRARTYEDHVDETGMLSTSINILARNLQDMVKAHSMQKDRLTTLIENMGSALILIDARGYVSLINRAYKEIFQVQPSKFLFKRYHEVIEQEEIKKLIEEVFMTEKGIRRQILLPLKIERKHFEVYGAPIIGTNDEWKGIVLVFHDITELKKLEQMRKDFVANVSHELKTPVTSIKGFTETLLDGAMHDPETLKQFLTIILKESDRLQNLIHDLLDLSKIERQGFTLSIEQVHLDKLLKEVVAVLEGKAKEKQIQLLYEENGAPVIEGDNARLKQVFMNIISNGINYTPSGGIVKVSIHENESTVTVNVKDTGIGIAEEEIPRIFERFYRVSKDRSRNSGGTGLGLAIVKHLVEAHKGKIMVTSQLGVGTTFSIVLRKKLSQKG